MLSVRPEVQFRDVSLGIQIVGSVFHSSGLDCSVTHIGVNDFEVSSFVFPEDCVEHFVDECREALGLWWKVEHDLQAERLKFTCEPNEEKEE